MHVPPASHKVWTELHTNQNDWQPSFLAARMLIVRYRMELVKSRYHPYMLEKSAERLRELYAENKGCSSADQDLAKLFG